MRAQVQKLDSCHLHGTQSGTYDALVRTCTHVFACHIVGAHKKTNKYSGTVSVAATKKT